MASRLVLGCGSVGRRLAVAEDADTVVVITTDEHRVETLRNEGITAERADPTDPDVLREHADEPETVIVGDDLPERNLAAARTARVLYPDAFVLAFAGRGPSKRQITELETIADSVVDPGGAIADYLMERVGDEGIRIRRLKRVLRDIDGPLAVVAHDNPDPDAIASAIALSYLARRAGTEAVPCYFGDISHQENRALVNLLEFELRNLEPDADLEEFGGFALVDHSRPGVNDQLPPDIDVDVVIDHHPPRAPVEARFVDLRSNVGATSTLLVDYFRRLNVEPPSDVATGLLFGIRVDTNDFAREVSVDDYEAAAVLLPYVDEPTLQRVESPSLSTETVSIVAAAIRNREVKDGILFTYVGEIGDRDALAQAADQLLDMETVDTSIVYGEVEDTIYLSARARGREIDLGEVLRDAFGQIGSAGGHADMAGAQIPVGALVEPDEDPDTRRENIQDVVSDRFLEAMGVATDAARAAAAVYAQEDYLGTETERVLPLEDTTSRYDQGADR